MIKNLQTILVELKNNLNNIVIKNKIKNKEKDFDYQQLVQSIERYLENYNILENSTDVNIINQLEIKAKELLDLTNNENIDLYIVKFINLSNFLIEYTPNNNIPEKKPSKTKLGKVLEKFNPKISKAEFSNRYNKLVQLLIPIGTSESNLILNTKIENTPFKLFKNSNNSIYVVAGQEKANMSVSEDKLLRVAFENENYTYPSYEEVIIEKILDDTIFNYFKKIDSKINDPYTLEFLNLKNEKADSLTAKKRISDYLENSSISIITKNNIEATLGVDDIANTLSSIIKKYPNDSGMMIGLFGKWGRGKTYLFERIENFINNTTTNKFKIVKFSAWKYQNTQESWAYLYEIFFDNYMNDKNNSTWYHKCLNWLKVKDMIKIFKFNKLKYGILPIIIFAISFLSYFFWSFIIDKIEFIKFIYNTIGIVILIKLFLMYSQYKNSALNFFNKYFSKTTFNKNLGLQAEIQKELKVLLKSWISKENEKIILFVDDLDRCNIEYIVNVLDGLRVILDDKDIYERLIIVTAVDEEILKQAIEHKYKSVIEHSKKPIFKEYLEKVFLLGIKLNPLTNDEAKIFLNKIIPSEMIKKNTKDTNNSKEHPILQNNTIKNNYTNSISDLNTHNDTITNEFEITEDEKSYLINQIIKLENNTPRKIRIFYYKYLIFKQLLHVRLGNLNLNNEWTKLDAKYKIIDILIDYTNDNTKDISKEIDSKVLEEVNYIIKMISVI